MYGFIIKLPSPSLAYSFGRLEILGALSIQHSKNLLNEPSEPPTS
jgi:hypothetical protein